MSKKWEEENNVLNGNNIAFRKLPDPENTKVYLFGKELTNGKDWKDFMERGLELQQENKELKNRVADLEAKLAESEHENQEYISKYRYWRGECAELNKQLAEKDTKLHEYIRCALEDYNDNIKEIIELKQQLSEKEAEIKNLVLAHFESDTNKPVLTTTQIINQDKISFCIEQLEKVRSFAYNTFKEFGCFDETDLEHILDNQIAELKKGSEQNDK